MKSNSIDAIVSTGPPHTTHLIAQKIANKYKIPWMADFRDPWTNIDFYNQLKLTSYADRKHKRLEKLVLKSANKVVTVSKSWAKDFTRISQVKPVVITNGFDPDDFIEAGKMELDKVFSMTHVGSLNKDRNPYILWKTISELIIENKSFAADIRIKLIGPIDVSINEELAKYDLLSITTLIDSLSHKEVLPHLIKAQVLLLPLNDVPNIDGVIPGKMYEYFGAERPIICIGKNNGDAAEIIKETQTGIAVSFQDKDKLKKEILLMYNQFKTGGLLLNSKNYMKYSRKNLTAKIVAVLDEIIK